MPCNQRNMPRFENVRPNTLWAAHYMTISYVQNVANRWLCASNTVVGLFSNRS